MCWSVYCHDTNRFLLWDLQINVIALYIRAMYEALLGFVDSWIAAYTCNLSEWKSRQPYRYTPGEGGGQLQYQNVPVLKDALGKKKKIPILKGSSACFIPIKV